MADYAEIDFEAWSPEQGRKLIPSNEDIRATAPTMRLAHAIMLLSKAELVEGVAKLDEDVIVQTIDLLTDTKERLGVLVGMVESAEQRMFVAASVRAAPQEVEFERRLARVQ